jgi:hypothetical protein
MVKGEQKTGDTQETAQKYEESMEILENQISMVKTSCGEVIRNMKEEIADLMEDRCRMEIDLLNQLASVDHENRNKERDFEQQLQNKDEMIQRLRKGGGGVSAHDGDMQELENEISLLMHAKKKMEDQLAQEREEADDEIHRLEDANTKLERKLEAAAEDLAILRSEQNSQDIVKALDSITKEREDIVATLDRVAAIWDRADASVLSLEDAMDQFRPHDDIQVKGDRERLLSTLETASLVHGQVKVSLLLIELKLRNQLQSLKNDKLSMTWAAPCDDEVIKNMRDIQKQASAAVDHVQATLSQQIHQMEERALEETKLMKDAIQQRGETLQTIQTDHKELEKQIAWLKAINNEPNERILAPAVSFNEANSPEKPAIAISKPVLDQLQDEVLRIVERVKAKNENIQTLKAELDEYKIREQQLKKELKRATRRPSKAENGKEVKQVSTAIESKLVSLEEFRKREEPLKKESKKSVKHRSKSEGGKQAKQLSTASESKPPVSPTKSPGKASPTHSTGNIAELRSSPVKTSPQSFKPLQPSPREISKPRMSLPFTQLPSSPSKMSPTVRPES